MRIIVSAFILILVGGLFANALFVPASIDYVSDYAQMLSLGEQNQISQKLREYDKKTTNQVVVLTVKSLEGESIESFGIHVAEKWKVGQKGKDNGVIFIISKEDRKTRIEVGYGLESVLTDLQCALILDQIVKPRFRAEKYYEGIDDATNAIIKIISGELKLSNVTSSGRGKLPPMFIFYIAIIILFLLVKWLYWRFWGYTGLGGGFWSSGGWGGGSSGGGSGFSIGGFSGGGGSFGGGGASGGW